MLNYERTIRILMVLLVVLLIFIGAILALPPAVRALPGRYAYYLPEPLLELRRVPHANTLATPETPPATTVALIPPTATPPPPTPTPFPTAQPSPTPTPQPTPTPTLVPTCYLEGGRQERQGWNNCGPTTLAMQLSFWKRAETQAEIAPVLKPDPEDKNVGPYEMAEYARSLGMGAAVRAGGDLQLLKRLLAHGYPVIVETWYVHTPDDQMGHYRLLVGYDDTAEEFTTYDSLSTPEIVMGYRELDELWRAFNRLYVVVYPPERAEELARLLGRAVDEQAAFEEALATAWAEVQNPPEACVAYADCSDAEIFAWFNVGTNLNALGRHEEAAAAYDRARELGVHYRMIWYQFGPYESYYAVGRYDDVIALADQTLRVTPNLEESYYWRGRARLAKGDVAGAREDFEKALRYHEGWAPALEALTD